METATHFHGLYQVAKGFKQRFELQDRLAVRTPGESHENFASNPDNISAVERGRCGKTQYLAISLNRRGDVLHFRTTSFQAHDWKDSYFVQHNYRVFHERRIWQIA